jgi:hypothetical protein
MKPDIELISTGQNLFVVVDGVAIAKRGAPGTPGAHKWIILVEGWTVRDIEGGLEISRPSLH